ncbi:phosphoglycolate phosphatase [Natronospira proteinivora]|uniref:Phosphoglycolate phosphatase n=1 Tax=Natronospira proteinivora TaxID=1807133 RepID=A0ABT1G6M4_9GAMM|nr:HAD-IA family hydrolase [Natronospira proteinivora]MCP1726939.1 phosphoglycolate phosphatase [Natronospira proteinivora]
MSICALLLDLDGTLADTAPDLGGALNEIRAQRGYPALAAEVIRPVASNGARGLLKVGFDLAPEHPDYEDLREALLAAYIQRIAQKTRLFDGMAKLLKQLQDRDVVWGVVTNKPAWLTDPLMEALAVNPAAACIVSGDTVSRSKPHPEPLLHAATIIGCQPQECIYVGDAPRDIQAAQAAGMVPLAAAWGYLPPAPPIEGWGAMEVIPDPAALSDWLLARLADHDKTMSAS